MKRCPECRRDYYDDSLLYCLDDGAALLEGPASMDEPATAILSEPAAVASGLTRHTEGSESKTAILDPPATAGGSGPLATRQKWIIPMVTVLLVAGGGIGFAIYKFGWPDKPTASGAPFQSIKIERLTSNGKATQAVISSDGKQVVYVLDDGGKRSLWLRQVATATDVQLTAASNDFFYWALTISPDGNFLYYVYGGTIRSRTLYQMSLIGGSPKKIIDDVGSPVGFSPDGKQIAFVRSRENESVMMITNADGSGEREVAKRTGGESFGNLFTGGVAWSPDGKKIACVASKSDADGRFQNVVEISIDDGTERPLTSHRWYEIHRLALLADGSGLLVTAAEKASEFRSKQVWYIPYSGGEARKITHDLNNYNTISLSTDSSSFVVVQQEEAANIWIAPDGDSGRAVQISSVSGKMDGYDGVAWTPDGRIVYTSMAGGTEAIWIMDVDGKNRKQLSSGEGSAFFPSLSTDGRYIVYSSERGRVRSVWRMDLDGSNQKQLSEPGGGIPQATNEWVFFGNVFKAPIGGGEPVRIVEEPGLGRCIISPDGKLMACQLDPSGEDAKIKVISTVDAAAIRVFDVKLVLPSRIRWAPDGRSITYVSRLDGLTDIWSQPIDGGEPKRLTNFKADAIFSFDWSRDNKLVISHGKSDSDVVLIRNTK